MAETMGLHLAGSKAVRLESRRAEMKGSNLARWKAVHSELKMVEMMVDSRVDWRAWLIWMDLQTGSRMAETRDYSWANEKLMDSRMVVMMAWWK